MNWTKFRKIPWVDTRASFVAGTPRDGTLLDIGSSDGQTLRHMAELRPDLSFFSTDLAGVPASYPAGTQFHRGDLQRDQMPWPNASMDAITCMHLVEHLTSHGLLFREIGRLVKPGGRVYLETPHPRSLLMSSPQGDFAGRFTLNFFDDETHIKPMTLGVLGQYARGAGLKVCRTGVSRNLLFTAMHLVYMFLPASRQKYTAYAHWKGWSAFLIAKRPV